MVARWVIRILAVLTLAAALGACSAPIEERGTSNLLPASLPDGLTTADVTLLLRHGLEGLRRGLVANEDASGAPLAEMLAAPRDFACTFEVRRSNLWVCNKYDEITLGDASTMAALHARVSDQLLHDTDELIGILSDPSRVSQAAQLLSRMPEDGEFRSEVVRRSPPAGSPLPYAFSVYEAGAAAFSPLQLGANAGRESLFARFNAATAPVSRAEALRYAIVLARLALRFPEL